MGLIKLAVAVVVLLNLYAVFGQDLSFYSNLCGNFAGYSNGHVDYGTNRVYFYNSCPCTSGVSYPLNLLVNGIYWFSYGGTNYIIMWEEGMEIFQLSMVYNPVDFIHYMSYSNSVYNWVKWPFCDKCELGTYTTTTNNAYSVGSNFVNYQLDVLCDERTSVTSPYNAAYNTTTNGNSYDTPMFIYYNPSGTVQKFNYMFGSCGWTGFCGE